MITRIMTQNKELKEFIDEMIKILEEKRPKYKDTWMKCGIETLKTKLNEQTENWFIDSVILKNSIIPENKENTKRNLIHIANYCYFLYSRLSE